MATDDETLGQITRLLEDKFKDLKENIREQIAFGDNTNRQVIEFLRSDLAAVSSRLEQIVNNRDHENRIRELERSQRQLETTAQAAQDHENRLRVAEEKIPEPETMADIERRLRSLQKWAWGLPISSLMGATSLGLGAYEIFKK